MVNIYIYIYIYGKFIYKWCLPQLQLRVARMLWHRSKHKHHYKILQTPKEKISHHYESVSEVSTILKI